MLEILMPEPQAKVLYLQEIMEELEKRVSQKYNFVKT